MSKSRTASSRDTAARVGWKQDPEAVRRDILIAARHEFSENGFAGGRIDEIAAKTKTSKRMIYYYFGDKQTLYREVLEDAYREIRAGEDALDVEQLTPFDGLRKVVEFTFDHHRRHPDVVRLIMIENIHYGRHLAHSDVIRSVNQGAIQKLERIYRAGCEAGAFRTGLSVLQLHWQISALCFFNVSNTSTFSLIFGNTLRTPGAQVQLRDHVVEMVRRFVAA